MKLQTRLLVYSAALSLWLLSGIMFGFQGIASWGVGLVILTVGYEVINYYVIKRRMKNQ